MRLDSIIESYNHSIRGTGLNVSIMLVLIRRFSPFIIKAKESDASTDTPINVIATMNAGFIPQNVWVQDMEIGGGRIIGEACHYVDLITYLTGSKVVISQYECFGE